MGESFGVVIIMENELFFSKTGTIPIHYNHMLIFRRNPAFVADVGTSQSIIASDHDTIYLSCLQLFDCLACLPLKRVLEDLKAIENKP